MWPAFRGLLNYRIYSELSVAFSICITRRFPNCVFKTTGFAETNLAPFYRIIYIAGANVIFRGSSEFLRAVFIVERTF